jgi:hypothetical protein
MVASAVQTKRAKEQNGNDIIARTARILEMYSLASAAQRTARQEDSTRIIGFSAKNIAIVAISPEYRPRPMLPGYVAIRGRIQSYKNKLGYGRMG